MALFNHEYPKDWHFSYSSLMKTPFRWLVKGLVLSSVLIGGPVRAQEGVPVARGWHAHPIMRSTQQLLTSCLAPNQPLVVASTPHGVFAWNYDTNQGGVGNCRLELAAGRRGASCALLARWQAIVGWSRNL